jgi:hypothetical protein
MRNRSVVFNSGCGNHWGIDVSVINRLITVSEQIPANRLGARWILRLAVWGGFGLGAMPAADARPDLSELLPASEWQQQAAAQEQVAEERYLARSSSRSSRKAKRKRRSRRAPPPYYASLGLGKTLPGGYYRFRTISRLGRGSTGYDSDGSTLDLGYEANVMAQAFVAEYGVTENLSFQLLVPYVLKNQLALDYRQFMQTDTFAGEVNRLESLMINGLMNHPAGLCDSPTSCQELIASGASLPEGTNLTLPTGEQLPIGGVPLDQVQGQIPQLVKKGATPVDGETGVGDIDFGVLYAFASGRRYVWAVGGGFRLPSGSYEDVPTARRGTGEGLMQGALRLNFDYNPIPALWLSWQNQTEFVLMEGRKKKSSLLDPDQLNQADPTSPQAIQSGSDGRPNSQTVGRDGLRQHGLLRADYALADWAASLTPVSIETILLYDFGAATTLDGEVQGEAPRSLQYRIGAKFDALAFDPPLPAYLKISRQDYLQGRGIPLALASYLFEFSFYTRF